MTDLNRYIEYTTRAGDTYDMLALDFYNEEKLAHHIIEANPMYLGTVVFSEGVKLVIPIIPTTEDTAALPPWRR